jgi:hypothetical protein
MMGGELTKEGKKRGVLYVDRGGDRRSYTILAQDFL